MEEIYVMKKRNLFKMLTVVCVAGIMLIGCGNSKNTEDTSKKSTVTVTDVKGEVDKKLSEQMGEGFTAAKFKGPEDGSYLIIRYGPDEDGNEKAGSISPAGIFVDMTQ